MNIIFPVILLASAVALCFVSPDSFVASLTAGAEKSVTLSLTLTGVYCVWLGLYEIAESAAITPKLAKILKKPIRFLYGKCDKETEDILCVQSAANMLGLGGIATPLGISAAERLGAKNNFYAFTMLLVVASTSLQLLPTSVLSLRSAMGSIDPSSVVLPSILSTLVSSVSGITLTKIFIKR